MKLRMRPRSMPSGVVTTTVTIAAAMVAMVAMVATVDTDTV